MKPAVNVYKGSFNLSWVRSQVLKTAVQELESTPGWLLTHLGIAFTHLALCNVCHWLCCFLVIEPAPASAQQSGGSGASHCLETHRALTGPLSDSPWSQQNCSFPQMGIKSNKPCSLAVYITPNARLTIASSLWSSFPAPV